MHLVGDIMADSLALALTRIDPRSEILSRFGIKEHSYLLATIHRAENTDQPENLKAILTAFQLLNEPILFPVHPRTRKTLEKMEYSCPANVKMVDPVGYLDMVRLEKDGPHDPDGFRGDSKRGLLAGRSLRHFAERNGVG